MKTALSILFVCFSIVVTAQKEDAKTLLKKYLEENRRSTGKPISPSIKIIPPGSYFRYTDSLRLLTVLPGNTKIYSLPQDQMLCIVPDMNVYTMPNAGKQLTPDLRFRGLIPNPAKPFALPDAEEKSKSPAD